MELYAVVGGSAQIGVEFNLYKLEFNLKEVEGGLGFGIGGKGKLETTGEVGYDLYKIGTEQKDGTNSIGGKIEIGGQVGPLQLKAMELKGGLQKNNGEYGAATSFIGASGEVKLVKGLGLGAVAKVDVFNSLYKR